MSPSSDTLTLSAGSTTTPLGIFDLQPATFFVGDSGFLSGTFPYTFNENVTINGDTQTVPISVSLVVTNPNQANLDTLAILASTSPIFFAGPGVDLTIQSYATSGYGVGGQENFMLTANLAQHVPEPGSLALFGLGLLSLVIKRRKYS